MYNIISIVLSIISIILTYKIYTFTLSEYCIPFEPAMQTFEPQSALN